MKPVPLELLSSPFITGIMLPTNDTDALLQKVIQKLEGNHSDRGMFRPVPLEDERAYQEAAKSIIQQNAAVRVEDAAMAILIDDIGQRHALRLIQRLTH